jgi:general secretion pathway protein D
MKIFLFFVSFFFSFWAVNAQVPAGQDQVEQQPQLSGASQQDVAFPTAIFSDPSEIELIEGLDEPLERVKLRDQDTNLILDMIQSITGRYILRPQNLPQVKINFDSMDILTKRETLLALESLLAMNGIGITRIDSQFYKAVPASGMNVHVPIWIDVPASSLAPSQRVYVKMFQLKYVPVEKMREILNPFATPNVSSLIIFPNSNSIMITDSLLNLQRMEKIIEKTDLSKDESDFILNWYIPQRFSAEVLQKEFEGKYESFFKTDFHIKPQFIVPESNDQLGIFCHVLDKKRIEAIFKSMDVEMLNPIKSKLVPLYHASAESVAKTLESFLNTSGSSKSSGSVKPANSSNASPPSSGGGANSTGTATDAFFSPFSKVVADKRSNGLFLSGTLGDLERLENMINELDTPLPMARIDTIFVMVDLSESKQTGIDALLGNMEWDDTQQDVSETVTEDPTPQDPNNGDERVVRVNRTTGGENLTGDLKIPGINSSLGFEMENWKLKKIQWGQIFSMASERKDVRIFSTPSITVIHGGGDADEKSGAGKSKIQILDTRSVGTYNYGYSGTGRTDPNDPSSSLTDRTAKTELAISNPRIRKTKINPETGELELGTVFMSVQVTAEKFDETNINTYEGQNLPSIKSRIAETDLAIRDGQIMVLGGLQEVQLDSTNSKYNLLSDIPYFGEKFFSPRNEKYTPTELMIFIRPTIIDPENPSHNLTDKNVNTLDSMMMPEYTPRFISPSGKILGVESVQAIGSNPDQPSSKPSL